MAVASNSGSRPVFAPQKTQIVATRAMLAGRWRPGRHRWPRSTFLPMDVPDLAQARTVVGLADQAIAQAVRRLGELGGPDRQQVFAYDLAHAAAGVATATAMLDYGEHGDAEAALTCGVVADAVHDLVSKLIGREQLWGVDPVLLAPAHDFVTAYRDPDMLASLAASPGPRHLDAEME